MVGKGDMEDAIQFRNVKLEVLEIISGGDVPQRDEGMGLELGKVAGAGEKFEKAFFFKWASVKLREYNVS